MKKALLSITFFLLIANIIFAQSPQQLNYQAVVRDASGKALAGNTTVSVRFVIHNDSATGTNAFQETTTAVTNQFGLIELLVGSNGNLATVNWSTGKKYLQVLIDPTGGSTYADMGTSQLLSVPYALFAANSIPGPPGATGPSGAQGPSGAGAAGPQGVTGPTGPAGAGGSGTGSNDSTGWQLGGNVGTVDGTNFLGTVDSVPLTIRVNNKVAGRIDPVGTTFYGYQSGVANVNNAFSYNTGIGYQCLYTNTTGSVNTAVGYQSLYFNTTGAQNIAIGKDALFYNTTGYSNTAVGVAALFLNTTATNNTAVGYAALENNSTGLGNTGVGNKALNANTSGWGNTATGNGALNLNTTGLWNTADGYQALQTNGTGRANTVSGYGAMYNNTLGSYNTAAGYEALQFNTTGNYNTAIGYEAGLTANTAFANISGTNNTFIGYNSGPGTANQLTNATALGANALVSVSNAVVIGGTGINAVRVGIGTESPTAPLQVVGLPVYANNAAAITGGLTVGAFYRTGADPDMVCVVH